MGRADRDPVRDPFLPHPPHPTSRRAISLTLLLPELTTATPPRPVSSPSSGNKCLQPAFEELLQLSILRYPVGWVEVLRKPTLWHVPALQPSTERANE